MRSIFIVGLLSYSIAAGAQIGGQSSMGFLNQSGNARLSALGGINVSLHDRDVNFFAANPALVGDSLKGFASVNYQFFVADIGQAFVAYAHHFPKAGTIIFGVQHVDYGEIQGYDETGTETQTYSSGETSLMVGKSHQVGNYRLGASMKAVFSSIAGYGASAVVLDFGGIFIHPNKRFTAGLAIKNAGIFLQHYSGTRKNKLPFDVQLGATIKPEHMPLRFSLTAANLTETDPTYYDPSLGGEKPGVFRKIINHFNLGAEILIHRNASLMAGYNFLNHDALKLKGGGGSAGVSFGFSARTKAIEFAFSRSGLAAGKAGYTFSVMTNLNKIISRRQSL